MQTTMEFNKKMLMDKQLYKIKIIPQVYNLKISSKKFQTSLRSLLIFHKIFKVTK